MKHFKGTVTFTFNSYAEDADDMETELRLKLDDLMAADEKINIDKFGADIEVKEIKDEND